MDLLTLTTFLALAAGFYAAWNIGANDVSNAMGTSVGSKSLSLRQAVIIAAIFEFAGAWFFGSNVSETLRSGILDIKAISTGAAGEHGIIIGMLSALLATGVWLHLASFLGLPVSTTHAIVGAIVGFGIMAGGFSVVHWPMLGKIASSWIISPLMGGFGAYFIFSTIKKSILSKPAPLKAAKKVLPWFFALFITLSSAIWMSSKSYEAHIVLFSSLCLGLVSVALFQLSEHLFISKESKEELAHIEEMERLVSLRRRKSLLLLNSASDNSNSYQEEKAAIDRELSEIAIHLHPASIAQYEEKQFLRLEKLFSVLQVATACLMAFAHGANDVANAIGPLEAVLEGLSFQGSSLAMTFLPHTLLFGGVGIVIGLATWGWRVIETIGKNITELTPSRGFSAEFGASMTILLASKCGLPISTTHTLVGAVIGVGFAGGIATLNMKTLKDIVASWIITIPGGALLSIIWYQILSSGYSYLISP